MTDAAMMSLLVTDHFEDDDSALEDAVQQVPTRKRSMRARRENVRLEEAYCLSQALEWEVPHGAEAAEQRELSCDSAAESAEEEAAAALLLGMGLPTAAPAAVPRSPGAVSSKAASRSSCNGNPRFRCTSCGQPAALRGEKRPTFFCGSCPAKGGAQKRAQRALYGADNRLISVAEATEMLACARGATKQASGDAHHSASAAASTQQQQRACPPIFQQAAPPQQEAAGTKSGSDVARLGSLLPPCMQRRGSSDPDWVPSAATLTRAASEGSSSDANQGRCKCGKRISATHPPCKSELMLLCEKFQARFGGRAAESAPGQQQGAPAQQQQQPALILLNEAAIELAVPRRRLYDIINVLEAVEIVSRTGKLAYEWRGLAGLPQLLDRLVADKLAGIPVEDRLRRTPVAAAKAAAAAGGAEKGQGDVRDEPSQAAPARAAPAAAPSTHSLWMLSRKFVRLLLTTQGPIPLAEAAAALIGNDVAAAKRAQAQITVERRLYDIGSILSSVGLIEKTYLGKRQPAFSWKWPWKPSSALPAKEALQQHQLPPSLAKVGAGSSDNSSESRELRLLAPCPASQGHDAGGSLTPSSAGGSAAALKGPWFGACPADAQHAAAAAPEHQPSEGPAAKRARVLLGETGQRGLPHLAPALSLQSLDLPAEPTEQLQRHDSGGERLIRESMPAVSVANLGWPYGIAPCMLPLPLQHYGAAAVPPYPASFPFPPHGAVDFAALWGHLPGAGNMDALSASIRAFPHAPAPSHAHPSLYGLAPMRALQQ